MNGAKKRLHWSSNPKLLRTGAVSFCLPAGFSSSGFHVCRGASAGCIFWCYGSNSRYETPRVRQPREINLAIVMQSLPRFVELAVEDLRRADFTMQRIRIHDSGDHYSQAYYDAWCRISSLVVEKTFYCFTKSLDLSLWTARPRNLIVVQSELGKFDDTIDWSKKTARVFWSHEERIAAGYADGTKDDLLVFDESVLRIGHVYHGPKGRTRNEKIKLMLRPDRRLPSAVPWPR